MDFLPSRIQRGPDYPGDNDSEKTMGKVYWSRDAVLRRTLGTRPLPTSFVQIITTILIPG